MQPLGIHLTVNKENFPAGYSDSQYRVWAYKCLQYAIDTAIKHHEDEPFDNRMWHELIIALEEALDFEYMLKGLDRRDEELKQLQEDEI